MRKQPYSSPNRDGNMRLGWCFLRLNAKISFKCDNMNKMSQYYKSECNSACNSCFKAYNSLECQKGDEKWY